MAVVAYAHIEVHGDVPYIAGTSTRVADLLKEQPAGPWDAAETQRRHPELTLGQIHSALAYYYDHQAELDALVEAEKRFDQQMRMEHGEFTAILRQKLRNQGLGAG